MDQLPTIINRLARANLETIEDIEAQARALSNDPDFENVLNPLIDLARIREGGYYSTFQDLFATEHLAFNQTDVTEFVRTRRPRSYEVIASKLTDLKSRVVTLRGQAILPSQLHDGWQLFRKIFSATRARVNLHISYQIHQYVRCILWMWGVGSYLWMQSTCQPRGSHDETCSMLQKLKRNGGKWPLMDSKDPIGPTKFPIAL